MVVVFIVAVVGGLLVKAAEQMLPAVEALAEIGDKRG
jgi:hypothetical protein